MKLQQQKTSKLEIQLAALKKQIQLKDKQLLSANVRDLEALSAIKSLETGLKKENIQKLSVVDKEKRELLELATVQAKTQMDKHDLALFKENNTELA